MTALGAMEYDREVLASKADLFCTALGARQRAERTRLQLVRENAKLEGRLNAIRRRRDASPGRAPANGRLDADAPAVKDVPPAEFTPRLRSPVSPMSDAGASFATRSESASPLGLYSGRASPASPPRSPPRTPANHVRRLYTPMSEGGATRSPRSPRSSERQQMADVWVRPTYTEELHTIHATYSPVDGRIKHRSRRA